MSALFSFLSILWILLAGGHAVPSVGRSYYVPAQASTAYDGASIPALDDDSAPPPPASENNKRTVWTGGNFAKVIELIAAEETTVGRWMT